MFHDTLVPFAERRIIKMKKKVVSLLLATTMVASLAAGCGDSSSSGDGTEKTGKKV